eukprot:gnl/TRDRNA2_/TRDRNA2_212728_c0_seq1.p1 gnl/TRDRNA2_/TRDRNA2_212728_c0~~gnl/TRDRNA2_/TRDRNA2_212728_c0_seq1.p1  ORF type:complete len:137 (-),score=17.52 gnl/TRDRNA2_/TRDRNA2_212728_c0_seq1:71-481(-)
MGQIFEARKFIPKPSLSLAVPMLQKTVFRIAHFFIVPSRVGSVWAFARHSFVPCVLLISLGYIELGRQHLAAQGIAITTAVTPNAAAAPATVNEQLAYGTAFEFFLNNLGLSNEAAEQSVSDVESASNRVRLFYAG